MAANIFLGVLYLRNGGVVTPLPFLTYMNLESCNVVIAVLAGNFAYSLETNVLVHDVVCDEPLGINLRTFD